MSQPRPQTIQEEFRQSAASGPKSTKKKLPPPVSIRFSDEERAQLRRDAGKASLSAYIRHRIFGDAVTPRKRQYLRKRRQTTLDHESLARLLGVLGQSELATSMLALAMAARSGALPVTPELSEKLDQACDEIGDMRRALIVALNLKPED
ncbi:MAG: hypothetical protein AAF495_15800 [Pseudomonadota bacterium]